MLIVCMADARVYREKDDEQTVAIFQVRMERSGILSARSCGPGASATCSFWVAGCRLGRVYRQRGRTVAERLAIDAFQLA